MRAEQVFIVSEGAIEALGFPAAVEKPEESKQSFTESLNASGNWALRGQGRGVFNNGVSQGYSWVTNSKCSRLTHTHSSPLSRSMCLSLCLLLLPSSHYVFRGMLSSLRLELSSLAVWTCWSGRSGKFLWVRHSEKMNKCFVPHRPSLKRRQAARRDRWGINRYIF